MGQAIGHNFELAGNTVTYVGSNDDIFSLGDLVIWAVPYPALADLADQYGDQLAGKVVVDITNPLNFETWDELVVPADSSAAQELQKRLPNSKVLKAFNTTRPLPLPCKAAKSAVSNRRPSWWPVTMMTPRQPSRRL